MLRILLLLLALLVPPGVAATATCADTALCAGETSSSTCDGPGPYAAESTNFTGVWGSSGDARWGAGGWDRCKPSDHAIGAYAEKDDVAGQGRYSAQVRWDDVPSTTNSCYLSAGVYGRTGPSWAYRCPNTLHQPDPGWGETLP